jgi:hypothetical protein
MGSARWVSGSTDGGTTATSRAAQRRNHVDRNAPSFDEIQQKEFRASRLPPRHRNKLTREKQQQPNGKHGET